MAVAGGDLFVKNCSGAQNTETARLGARRSSLGRTSEPPHCSSTGREEQHVGSALNLGQGIVKSHFSFNPFDVAHEIRKFLFGG